MSHFRIAAIDFLNPAPLMWNFEHGPEAERLAQKYAIEKMTPSQCAARLGEGGAELGLIPIAAYASLPGLAIVPGCVIASKGSIRSILLVMRGHGGNNNAEPDLLGAEAQEALAQVQSVALDTASRTSAMYTRILFHKYWRRDVRFVGHTAQLDAMLEEADAALLIGDPALFALKERAAREEKTGERLLYLDMGDAWRKHTGLPWVSAFWAVRQAGFPESGTANELKADLLGSRDAGLARLPALAEEWSARLGLPLATVTAYLGRNIHYVLDEACIAGIERFYADAAEYGLIDREPELAFL